MTLQDLAQPLAAGRGQRLVEPGLERALRERRARPHQVEVDPALVLGGLEVEGGDAGRPVQRAGQPLEQQAERVALAVQPELRADHGQADLAAGEPAVDPAREVGAVEVGGRRVARGERLGGAREGLELLAERSALLDQHRDEGRALGLRSGQHLGRRAQRRERRPLRLDQLAQAAAAMRALGKPRRGVAEVQHEAVGRAVRGEDQRHAAAQLAVAIGAGAEELGARALGRGALAQLLEGMRDRLARQQAVERAVEAELRAASEGLQRRLVE